MTDEEFLAAFSETIGASPGEIAWDTRLKDLEIWDSIAYLSVMVLLDEKLSVALNPDALVGAESPAAIWEFARAATR